MIYFCLLCLLPYLLTYFYVAPSENVSHTSWRFFKTGVEKVVVCPRCIVSFCFVAYTMMTMTTPSHQVVDSLLLLLLFVFLLLFIFRNSVYEYIYNLHILHVFLFDMMDRKHCILLRSEILTLAYLPIHVDDAPATRQATELTFKVITGVVSRSSVRLCFSGEP